MKYSRNTIEYAKKLRAFGMSYREISEATDIEVPALVWHLKGTLPKANGRTIEVRKMEDLLCMWQPGREIPLPNWLLSLLEDQSPVEEQPGSLELHALPTGHEVRK